MADSNEQTRMPDTVMSALTWFRTVFVKAFAQGSVTKKALSKIVRQDKEFLVHFFQLMDNDESGTLCYQEFVGGLLRLGRGRNVSDKAFSNITLAFALKAGSGGEVNMTDFIPLCLEAKLSDCLFLFFDLNDSGAIDVKEFLMGIDKLARTNTDIKWYSWAEKWFIKNAAEDGYISKEQFLTYLNISKSSFADSLFAVVDNDQSGSVDVTELMQVIHVLTQGSATERLLLLFRMYDVDGDERLSYDEVTLVLERCLADSSLEGKEDIVGKLTNVLFQQLDTDKSGDVSLAEFELFLNQYPKIAENLTISFANCLRSEQRKSLLSRDRIQRNLARKMSLISNYRNFIVFWCLFTAVNVTLFVTAAHRYWDNHNIFVVLARGAGQCLNFNSAFIVVLMYRNIITYLKSTMMRKYLPLDHAIGAHKICGAVIVVFGLVHTAMHVANAEITTRETNATWVEVMFTLRPGVGWVGGSAFITGWVLVAVLAAIVGPSVICLRRRGYFQVFYWSHWLFIGWWAVLVIHASNFWKWLIGPATVYLLEKLWRHCHSHDRTDACIRSIQSVDSKVSEIIIERPPRFKFNAGEYILINIEAIAKFEWHPFTISSAPEQTDFLTLHVEVKGDWTSRLRSLGETMCSGVRIEQIEDELDVRTWPHWMLSENKFRGDNPSPFGYSNDAFELGQQMNQESKEEEHVESQVDSPQRCSAVCPIESTIQREPSVVTQTDGRFNTDITPLPSTVKRDPPASLLLSRLHPNKYFAKPQALNDCYPEKKLKVKIDGPFGAPSTEVYDVDHAILIGAGIGVTPFASILQSMVYRRKLQRAICSSCKHWWRVPGADSFIRTPRRVDFIWVTRTFDALKWFLDALSELEEEEALLGEEEKFLNIFLHVTSALGQSDIRAVALQMALELCHQEEFRDPLCGLRTRVQPGRPNWKKLFDNILKTSEGRKCVFYCGPPRLEKTLKKLCGEYHLGFKSENF